MRRVNASNPPAEAPTPTTGIGVRLAAEDGALSIEGVGVSADGMSLATTDCSD